MALPEQFRRCLMDLDVRAARACWAQLAPHLHQPENDDEALLTMHLTRVASDVFPDDRRQYSREWLAERETGRTAYAVGIAVGFAGEMSPRKYERMINVRGEMEHAVLGALQSGVDLSKDAAEVTERITAARQRSI